MTFPFLALLFLSQLNFFLGTLYIPQLVRLDSSTYLK